MTKTNISKAVTAHIVAKCSDLCFVSLLNGADETIAEHKGYVPDFMPGEHYGDYIEIDIDLETGRIRNWVKPDQKSLSKPTSHSEWMKP
jgi:hypothetical protein